MDSEPRRKPDAGKSPLPEDQRASGKEQGTAVQRLPHGAVQRALIDPQQLSPATVMMLQRTVGNAAVQRILAGRAKPQTPSAPLSVGASTELSSGQVVQPKLAVGPVADQYEQEADRVANQVLQLSTQPQTQQVQRHHEEEEMVQKKSLATTITPLVQRQSGSHGPGCGCPGCRVQRKANRQDAHPAFVTAPRPTQIQRMAHGHGCSCSKCSGVQRKVQRVAKDGSFEASDDLSNRVSHLSGKGAPLPDSIRSEMEPRFGADFSGVRIHTGAEGAQLSRQMSAQAFTHGQNIAFASGKFSPNTASGKHLLAHELTHTIQQSGVAQLQRQPASHGKGCTCSACSGVQRKENLDTKSQVADGSAAQLQVSARVSPFLSPVVQRHSTHEHYLLGTLGPDELSDIPLIRQQVQQANMSGKKFKSQEKMEKESSRLRSRQGSIDEDKRMEVIHILEQEMERLLVYKDQDAMEQLHRQKFNDTQSKIGKVEKIDDRYQVPLVEIPAKDGESVVCTYGELNTLADMFGTIEDMSNSSAEAIIGMLQGVRQRAYIVLYGIYHEIGGTELGKEVHRLRPGTSFEDVIGFSGKEKPLLGALGAVKGYEKATKVDGEFTEQNATAALIRNACHFAPETWYTWKRYHDKAREFARNAYEAKEEIAKVNEMSWDPFNTLPSLEEKQRDFANKALLYSGFGDHYLQDAYASGHLIDKTKVMQWFFEWQRSKKKLKNTPGYHMIAAIVEQELESNPQMMENVQGGIHEKLEHIGVEVKDHIKFLIWWRGEAYRDKKKKKLTGMQARGYGAPLAVDTAAEAINLMDRLTAMGFATVGTKKKVKVFDLKQEHINVLDPKKATTKEAPYQANTAYAGVSSRRQNPFYDEVEEFYYAAFNKFLDKNHLQLITNFLHNKFCAEGLEVETKDGEHIGRIYGDAAMVTAGAQDGVKHSATTGQMAREAIYDIINTGAARHTTAEIDDRFPRQIAPDWDGKGGNDPISIENWWTELKRECTKNNGLFAKGTSNKNVKSTGAKRVVKRGAKQRPMKPIDKILEEAFGMGDVKQPTHAIF